MTIFIVVATVLVIALPLFFRRSGVSPTKSVSVDEIAAIVSHLATLKDGSFAVFMFDSPLSPGGDAVNLQYSVEQGAVGLDWVLLGQTKLQTKKRYLRLQHRWVIQ